MRSLTTSFRNFAVLTLVASTLSACALPRPGPTRSELVSGSTEKGGDAFVVPVTADVARASALVPTLGFTSAFLRAGVIGSDIIRPGDTTERNA